MSRTTIEDETLDIGTLRPIQDYILVSVLDMTQTSSGLILPNGKNAECRIGKVLALGNGIWNDKRAEYLPFELKVGQHVLFMEYAGERIELRDGAYRMVHSRWRSEERRVGKECRL